jgi:predicted NodU family carbamoyl transferase
VDRFTASKIFSPFAEAVAVSVDGFGDFASTAWGLGRGRALAIDGRVLVPHSLGDFYQAMTQYLGFPHYGDEYKAMGLAPYGGFRTGGLAVFGGDNALENATDSDTLNGPLGGRSDY